MILARTLIALVVATPLARAGVIVVDGSGKGDFTTLSAAVAAAAGGDTILLRSGEYVEPAPVVVDGKPLTIVALPFSQTVTIRPGLVIRNLSPGELVILEHLELRGTASTATTAPTSGLSLLDNNSHVRIQDCGIAGGDGASNAFSSGAAAVSIQNSYSTALTGCFLTGGDGQFSPTLGVVCGAGGPGLTLSVGQAHLGYCNVEGGHGGSNAPGGFAQGGAGGTGVDLGAGTLLVVGGVVRGGDGGISHFGGAGGDGMILDGAGFAWMMAGPIVSGGSGGPSDVGPTGANGTPIVDLTGILTNFGGTPHDFDVPSPLIEGQGGTLSFGGDFQSSKIVFASLSPHQIAFPDKQGVLMLAPDALIGPFVLGSGTDHVTFFVPPLPAALPAINLHLQAVYIFSAHSVSLGAGRVLTLLDASYL